MLCTTRTEAECIGRSLFGDRDSRLELLKEIQEGDKGFLLNVSKNQLMGVFVARSGAELDIERDAWGGNFRAQVRVEILGKMQRINNGTTVLANAGVGLIPLTSGLLAPAWPVHYEKTFTKILEHFEREENKGT